MLRRKSTRAFQQEASRRKRLKWEFLRRNEKYQKDYQDFVIDPKRYWQKGVYAPPLQAGETKDDWKRRGQWPPGWVERRLPPFRRKWGIAYPHDPNDPDGWKTTEVSPEAEFVSVLWPSPTLDPLYTWEDPEEYLRYLHLRLDLTQPMDKLLHLVKEKIQLGKQDLPLHSYFRERPKRAPSFDDLEEALQIYDLVTKYPPGKRNWADIAREWKPELRGVRLNRAKSGTQQSNLLATRELVKSRWELAKEYVEGRYRGI